jgi:hypothetical protein
VALEAKPSAGHEAEAPLQVSATSQTPADARHVFPDVNESAGQLVDEPVQLSAVSQTPAEARQTVAALAKQLPADSLHVLPQIPPPAHGLPECTLHVPPAHVSVPLQNTPSSQTLPSPPLQVLVSSLQDPAHGPVPLPHGSPG